MQIIKFLFAILLLLLTSTTSSGAAPEYAKPIDAYQKKYDMSFFVWKPLGLHSKWYATYDGFPVTEIAKDQWVYGVIGSAGELSESVTAVGSVDPRTVHFFTPLPPFLSENLFNQEYKFAKSLKKIFKTKCDSYSIAHTRVSPTPIAWESGTLKVHMWGGKRWIQIRHRAGEKLSESIKRDSNIVANMLKTCKIAWTQIDSLEFANYVKSVGYTWIDDFEKNMPPIFNEIGSKNSGGGYMGISSGGSSDPDNPDTPDNPGNGGWDTGKDP